MPKILLFTHITHINNIPMTLTKHIQCALANRLLLLNQFVIFGFQTTSQETRLIHQKRTEVRYLTRVNDRRLRGDQLKRVFFYGVYG